MMKLNEFFFYRNVSHIRGKLLIVWAIAFPFWIKLSTVLIIISTLLYIVDSIRNNKWIYNFKQHLPLLLLVLMYVIALLYTKNIAVGLDELKKKTPFLLVPFAFWGVDIVYSIKIKQGLIVSLLIYFAYCVIASAFFASQYFGVSFLTSFHQFVNERWHASYLGLFILIGMIFSILELIDNSSKVGKLYSILVVFILGAFVFMNTARTEILVAGIFCFIAVCICIGRLKIRRVYIVTGGIVFVCVCCTLGYHFSSLVVKYIHDDPRSEIWSSVFHLINHHWIMGISPGDVRDLIAQYFMNRGNILYADSWFNTHNQFLEILLGLGLPGLLMLIFILLIPIFRLKYKFTYVLFLISIIISFISESILSRQAGMIFFSFFYYFFLWDRDPKHAFITVKFHHRVLRVLIVSVALIISLFSGLYCWNKLPCTKDKDQSLEIVYQIQILKNDKFLVLYNTYTRPQFSESYKSVVTICGSNQFQTIRFKIHDKGIKQIRLDFGENRDQDSITVVNPSLVVNHRIFNLDFDKFSFRVTPWCNVTRIKSNVNTFGASLRVLNGVYAPYIISNDLTVMLRQGSGYYYVFFCLFILLWFSIILITFGMFVRTLDVK